MTNTDPGAPEYEYEWQNPDRKSFDVGRVISRTFKALKNNPIPFLVLTFIGAGLPIMLISMWPVLLGIGDGINLNDPNWIEDVEWGGIIGPLGAGIVLYMFLTIFTYGAIIKMAVEALNDRPAYIGDGLKMGARMFFPFLVMYLIFYIAMIIGFLLLIIPGLLIALGWTLAFNIKIMEGTTMTDALSRSWTLSKGYKRWILLMMVIFGILGSLIGVVFQIPSMFFGNSQTAMIDGGSMAFWVANAIGSGLTQMVTAALSYIGLTATYLEIRRVKEGVDPERIADIFS